MLGKQGVLSRKENRLDFFKCRCQTGFLRVPFVSNSIRGGEARGFPSDTPENTRFVSVPGPAVRFDANPNKTKA